MVLEAKDLNKLWLYFSSLCLDLENTTPYINHKEIQYVDNGILKESNNKKTHSDIFLKILLSACSEFEVVTKLLCNQIDTNFDILDRNKNISHISKIILEKYPQIISCEVKTNFDIFCPFENWSINTQNKVDGLSWWDDYNSLKHSRFTNLYKANLENCIGALSCLYIIELYLQMHVIGNTDIASIDGYYFSSDYIRPHLLTLPKEKLPDFKITAP